MLEPKGVAFCINERFSYASLATSFMRSNVARQNAQLLSLCTSLRPADRVVAGHLLLQVLDRALLRVEAEDGEAASSPGR